jgi:NAD-dependent dihydropyrimidine dehydrogenase PreA subunit
LEIVTDITDGKGTMADIQLLEELARTVKDSTMCGLGQTSSNPVLSTLKYFRDEYEAHIGAHKCPAGNCLALVEFGIDPARCTGCTLCARNCPVNAITGEKKKTHLIDTSKCVKCGRCITSCNFGAVLKA